ncbi:response regulator [Xylophilus rhododendri]|uniref:Response regulator n=1 Tax=Xylophilus rhododendri TaxID=2697032 RepID=A0A857J7I2_9BURK|nr:response regulator [Xylophilus rhododendri]QHI99990.1 response regulator [Xylophilus rhododendri]
MHDTTIGRPARHVERRGRHRRLCLVIDDDAVCRSAAQRQLRTLGFDAILAASSREAMDLIDQRKPSTVLIDNCLPDGDGYSLARRIRHLERAIVDRRSAWPLVLVALSAHAGKLHLGRCLAAGMDQVLSKPVSLPALASALGVASTDARAPGNLHISRSGPLAQNAVLSELYWSSCRADLEVLKKAVDARDWSLVRARAHRIRGASQVVGMHSVAGLAFVLERLDDAEMSHSGIRALRWLGRLVAHGG